ncbi:expressed protein [Phakopsora pachyrhizi]|uniref:Expressed protein n=1 Tax=Phakopsora pachyrhizi TaxID=170000 RepID=A0AAV0B3W2_PHAPC|nr:expressed protein [Phakopsora pachyrhizi]
MVPTTNYDQSMPAGASYLSSSNISAGDDQSNPQEYCINHSIEIYNQQLIDQSRAVHQYEQASNTQPEIEQLTRQIPLRNLNSARNPSSKKTRSNTKGATEKKYACNWPGCDKSFSRPDHLTDLLTRHLERHEKRAAASASSSVNIHVPPNPIVGSSQKSQELYDGLKPGSSTFQERIKVNHYGFNQPNKLTTANQSPYYGIQQPQTFSQSNSSGPEQQTFDPLSHSKHLYPHPY